jgi:hypothetical protein
VPRHFIGTTRRHPRLDFLGRASSDARRRIKTRPVPLPPPQLVAPVGAVSARVRPDPSRPFPTSFQPLSNLFPSSFHPLCIPSHTRASTDVRSAVDPLPAPRGTPVLVYASLAFPRLPPERRYSSLPRSLSLSLSLSRPCHAFVDALEFKQTSFSRKLAFFPPPLHPIIFIDFSTRQITYS